MKKIIILAFGIILIGILGFYAVELASTEKASDPTSLIDFAIKDTSSVDKIKIYDSFLNQEFEIQRGKDGVWTDSDGNCIQQEPVQIMLETFYKVTLKGYVPEGAMDNMKRLLMAKHKKIDIYQNGKWSKTWYVGHPTQDHNGTHMLLETPKQKSDNPVIMSMIGFYGILEPRFFADARSYRCTHLFSFDRAEISKVEVKNNINPNESFEINTTASEYIVTSNGQPLENVIKDNLVFYMNGFKNIHFNQPNYTMSIAEMDSMKLLPPDYQLKLEGSGRRFEMNFYRRLDLETSTPDSLVFDSDYLWGVKQDGEVVRMQYYVIGPLIDGQTVFVNKSVNN
jgi:hypothetical protein